MRLLLDTHVLLWWWQDDPHLSDELRAQIATPSHELFVSVASAWEITIKTSLGKLRFPLERMTPLLDAEGFRLLPIQLIHALAVADLPWHHRDPFDRLLIAQARAEGLTLVTCDARFAQYEVAVLTG